MLNDFFSDIDDDNERWKVNLDEALLEFTSKELFEGIERGDYEEDSPIPESRLSGRIDKVSQAMGGQSWSGVLVAKAADGNLYQYQVSYNESFGSFYEPPDLEIIIEWDEVVA